MDSPSSPPLQIPVFSGQGTSTATISLARDKAILESRSGHGSTLLSVCHEAFLTELHSLSPLELAQSGIDLSDFRTREDLLSWPSRYYNNPVVSSSSLVLIQALSYLQFVQSFGIEQQSSTPFHDVQKRQSSVGILGFSSGVLAACIAASSSSTATFLSSSLEAYRLAVWIGIRGQMYRLKSALSEVDLKLPWSLVFVGLGVEAAKEALLNFEETTHGVSKSTHIHRLYITAVIDSSCVTISGLPTVLAKFSAEVERMFENSVVIRKTTVDTLYHSFPPGKGTRERVLEDIARRGIRFSNLSDLCVPIRSTFTGEILSPETVLRQPLVELVVDMLLTQPVRWDLVIKKVAEALSHNATTGTMRLLNFGPSSGLSRSIEKACPKGRIAIVDLQASALSHRTPKQEPIAIVGMAVNMPGSPNVAKLWEVLENGLNTLQEIPEQRFHLANLSPDRDSRRQMKTRTGNFVERVDEFDHHFFKISPREAKSMDPQQRILLHAAYEALEDSGYVPNSTPSTRPEMFGCYVGVATHDYIHNLRNDIDVYYSTGTLGAFLSGRISHAMKFGGPSIVVNTACSSSSVAIYQGVRALINRDCDSALVGGVNVISSPDMFIGLDRGHFLSHTGQCKTFDESADGYSRGEGCGMFVLKRFSDALSEHDNILGVIRGIEVNQSGLAHSITHPHVPTQMTLFKRVLENAGLDVNRVNVVEAHGTGTQAGDPSELESIRRVLAVNRDASNGLHVTSVKANIGHLEAASGAAGLAKLLLMFKHRVIPRQISLQNLNLNIAPLEMDHTVMDSVNVPWKPSHEGMTRIALLNNFGASGSNAALLVEEHRGLTRQPSPARMALVLGISAKDEPALERLRRKYIDWLEDAETQNVPLEDIAYTMTARRQIYPYRFAVTAEDRIELVDKLRNAPVVGPLCTSSKIVFVYSGQGGQYMGMGSSLYRTSPLFKQHVDECHSILLSMGFAGVLDFILGDSNPERNTLSPAEECEASQLTIVVLEYALTKLWQSWGVTPTAVIGHSLGEYTALIVSGVLSLRGALTLVAHRARLMVETCSLNSSGMVAVSLSPCDVRDMLTGSEEFSNIQIACYNSPSDCVLSGPLAQLAAFTSLLDLFKCRHVRLSVPFGYHSSAMSPIFERFATVVQGVDILPPTIPIASNVHGTIVMAGDNAVFDEAYFMRHCAEPVQFESGIRELVAQCQLRSTDAWIEIGPHGSLVPMLKSNPCIPEKAMLLTSLKRNHDPWSTLSACLAHLYSPTVPIQWRNVFSHIPSILCTPLPSYPFAKTRFWVAYEDDPLSGTHTSTHTISEYLLLEKWLKYPSRNSGLAVFETPVAQIANLIIGHSIGGHPLCPASVYIEMVLSGLELSLRNLNANLGHVHAILQNIVFSKPLVYKSSILRTITTTISLGDRSGSFTISSRVEHSTEEVFHVQGEYLLQPVSQTTSKFTRIIPAIRQSIDDVMCPDAITESFHTRTAYEVIFPRVVQYAKEYHTIQTLTVRMSGMDGFAQIRYPERRHQGTFVLYPVFTDTMLHVAGFIANMQGSVNDAYICSELSSVEVLIDSIDDDASYNIYCSGTRHEDGSTIVSEVWAIREGETPVVVAHMKGMQFRRVRLDNLTRSLAIAASAGSLVTQATRPLLGLHSRSRAYSLPPNFINMIGEHNSRIINIVAQLCDLKASLVDGATALDTLGIDSLMMIELLQRLKVVFPRAKLTSSSLSSCKTVADIICVTSSLSDAGTPPSIVSSLSTCAASESSSLNTLVVDDNLQNPLYSSADDLPDIRDIIATVLDIPVNTIRDDTEFESMGLDSLSSIEALQLLRSQYLGHIPSSFFDSYRTVKAAQGFFSEQREISTTLPGPSQESENRDLLLSSPSDLSHNKIAQTLRLCENPVSIESSGDITPLFLVHDGSGLVNYYERISPLGRTTWGIYNPHFISARPWSDIYSMAKEYVDYVCSLTRDGSILLGGWSFGGVVAYEMALQLGRRGVKVKGIVLIDSPSPINHSPMSDALIKSVVNFAKAGSAEIGKLVQQQFMMNTQMLAQYDPYATVGICPPLVLLRSEDAYTHKDIRDIPRWLADRSDPKSATEGWNSLTHIPIKVIDIPGHHFQPFTASNISHVSRKIQEACNYLDSI